MRKYVALIVDIVLAVGGLLLALDLFFVATIVPLLLVVGAGFLMVMGCYLTWETLRDWRNT